MARKKSGVTETEALQSSMEMGMEMDPVIATPTQLVDESGNRLYTIKDLAEMLDTYEMRVRALIRTGELEGQLRMLAGTHRQVWTVTEEALQRYLHQAPGRATQPRRAGKLWRLRLTQQQYDQLQPTLQAMGVELQPFYTYRPRQNKDADVPVDEAPVDEAPVNGYASINAIDHPETVSW